MDAADSNVIRFYEELNDFIRNHPPRQDISFALKGKRSIKDLIESFGVPHVEVDLILVNGEPVSFDYPVKPGDRISVYPMFERFDISRVSLLRNNTLRKNRFVIDVHLGKLARHLRLLGFDTDYNSDRDDPELAKISSEQHRILLTRDRGLLMRKIVRWGLIIRSDDPLVQIGEVLGKIDLYNDILPLTRCLSCNGIIEALPIGTPLFNKMKSIIPPQILQWCSEYNYCPDCKKVYWKGSHYESLMKQIENIRRRSL